MTYKDAMFILLNFARLERLVTKTSGNARLGSRDFLRDGLRDIQEGH